MLKHFVWLTLLILSLFLLALPAQAMPLETLPMPQVETGHWVTDAADLLSPSTQEELDQLISGLNADNGRRVFVVTVPEIAPETSSQQYAIDLFKHWDVDQSETVPGVLLLVSKGDRRIEIRTGLRAIGLLPNSRLQRILDAQIRPPFAYGRFDRGIVAGTKAIVKDLQPFHLPTPPGWLAVLLILVISSALGAAIRVLFKIPKNTFDGISEEDFQEFLAMHPDALKKINDGAHVATFSSGSGGAGGGTSGGGVGGSW